MRILYDPLSYWFYDISSSFLIKINQLYVELGTCFCSFDCPAFNRCRPEVLCWCLENLGLVTPCPKLASVFYLIEIITNDLILVPPASHLGKWDRLWGNYTLSAVFILSDFIISKPQDYLALIPALTFSTGRYSSIGSFVSPVIIKFMFLSLQILLYIFSTLVILSSSTNSPVFSFSLGHHNPIQVFDAFCSQSFLSFKF